MKKAQRNNKWLKARNKRQAKAHEFAKRKRDAGEPKILWGAKYHHILKGTSGFWC